MCPLAITSRGEGGGELKQYSTGTAAVPAGNQRQVIYTDALAL